MTQDLIARFEAATGPDRELDAEIAKHLGWVRFSYPAEIGWYDESGMCCDDCPRYTGSIDAAMTLVPEGYGIVFDMSPSGPTNADLIEQYDGEEILSNCLATHVCAAIALCIAALKARGETNAD